MKKVVTVPLSQQGVEDAIAELEKWQTWLIDRTKEFVKVLGDEGLEIMSVKFANAIYDGTNDVKCEIRPEGEMKLTLTAKGNATLFIEFGTGINHPDSHPEGVVNGMIHGEYGMGLGKLRKGWRYKGDPGTNGIPIVGGKNKGYVLTKGNPANMSMYLTIQELKDRVEEIARRVYA